MHLHVGGGEPGGLQPRRGGLGRRRHVAGRRVRRVDLDQFLEDRACPLFVWRGLRDQTDGQAQDGERGEELAHGGIIDFFFVFFVSS